MNSAGKPAGVASAYADMAALASEASVLRRLAESLSGGLALERVARAVVDLVVEEVGALNCSLYVIDPERNDLFLCAARGRGDSAASFYPKGGSYRRFALGEGVCGLAAKEGASILIDDVRQDPRFVPSDPLSDEIRSLLVTPLSANGNVVAVLNLSHEDLGAFGRDNESLLSLVSAQAGIALSNVHLFAGLTEANKRLAVSEGRLREYVARANDAILLTDATGHVVEANTKWEEFAGVPADSWDDLAVSGPSGASRSLKEFLRSEAFVRTGVRLEAVLERPGGPSSVIEISSKAFPFESEEACLVIIRDVTESKRLAEQLIRSEKLAAVGEVTAALAHEVNNPLGALYNSVCLLKRDLDLSGDNARLLDVAVEEATHLSEIVNDFLSFARFPHARFEWNDLNQQVSNALFLMKRDERMGPRVEVEAELAADLAAAQIDKSQLQEVLFNLISNSLDALDGKGRLAVRTYNAKLGGRSAIGVIVEDTGCGMTPEDKEKVFAPFFTTKAVGTGLGLSIVKRIVEEHQGVVAVESEPGKGCKVSVVVPVSREEGLWRPY